VQPYEILATFLTSSDIAAMGTSVNQADEAAQGAHNKDEAIAIVGEEQHAIDPIVAARAVRKIDMFLIPAMIIGCAYVATHMEAPTDES
jgi:hypothetical protein